MNARDKHVKVDKKRANVCLNWEEPGDLGTHLVSGSVVKIMFDGGVLQKMKTQSFTLGYQNVSLI